MPFYFSISTSPFHSSILKFCQGIYRFILLLKDGNTGMGRLMGVFTEKGDDYPPIPVYL